jgi:HTH-type transcriptional regulator/antitoxin HigA
MNIRPVENEDDYDWALREIAQYFEHEPARGTPEAARFSVLATLIRLRG